MSTEIITITSPRGQAMMDYLPGYYAYNTVMAGLAEARGAEFDLLAQALAETLQQFYARTATWSLDEWEDELGITNGSGTLTDSERQDRIVAKLTGIGTATLKLIKKTAESYNNGTIVVIQDYSAYKVTIRFVSNKGIPSNINDLKAILRDITPAHLGVEYEFTFVTWSEVAAMTWNIVKTKTWDELLNG